MAEIDSLPDDLRPHLLKPFGAGGPQGLPASGRVEAARGENPACGDVLDLSAGVDPAGSVRVGFRASACGGVLATASVLCEGVDGLSLSDARDFDLAARIQALGGLPAHRAHALRVVGRAWEQVLGALASD